MIEQMLSKRDGQRCYAADAILVAYEREGGEMGGQAYLVEQLF